jgi:hypothetical protein
MKIFEIFYDNSRSKTDIPIAHEMRKKSVADPFTGRMAPNNAHPPATTPKT